VYRDGGEHGDRQSTQVVTFALRRPYPRPRPETTSNPINASSAVATKKGSPGVQPEEPIGCFCVVGPVSDADA
jgi:hypothetical protein